MNLKKWLKKQMVNMSIAMSGLEKNALGQHGSTLDNSVTQERRHSQGTLADSLKQGEMTEEVQNLRWRIYKILRNSEGQNLKITGYDDDDLPITEVIKVNKAKDLRGISIDKSDAYPLEIVVNNTPIKLGGLGGVSDEFEMFDNPIENLDDEGNVISATHGEISVMDYENKNKGFLPIEVIRETLPKFEIEKYTKRLFVRSINKTEKLLEFHVSMYPDKENRSSRLFLTEVKKVKDNPRNKTLIEIKNVKFTSFKSTGVNDFLDYEYDIISYDKIVEFNGHYVIKFKAKVILDGVDILEEHRVEELDNKYKNKEAKKR